MREDLAVRTAVAQHNRFDDMKANAPLTAGCRLGAWCCRARRVVEGHHRMQQIASALAQACVVSKAASRRRPSRAGLIGRIAGGSTAHSRRRPRKFDRQKT
jgi:hypothetical protein